MPSGPVISGADRAEPPGHVTPVRGGGPLGGRGAWSRTQASPATSSLQLQSSPLQRPPNPSSPSAPSPPAAPTSAGSEAPGFVSGSLPAPHPSPGSGGPLAPRREESGCTFALGSSWTPRPSSASGSLDISVASRTLPHLPETPSFIPKLVQLGEENPSRVRNKLFSNTPPQPPAKHLLGLCPRSCEDSLRDFCPPGKKINLYLRKANLSSPAPPPHPKRREGTPEKTKREERARITMADVKLPHPGKYLRSLPLGRGCGGGHGLWLRPS